MSTQRFEAPSRPVALPPRPPSCFALRTELGASETVKWPPSAPALSQGLSELQCRDLADLLPFLACGEESAVLVFTGKLLHAAAAKAQLALRQMAEDERRHAALLERLRLELPPARALVPASRLAFFFRRLDSDDPGEHLARVAALDLAVCRLLQPLLARGAALSRAPALHLALSQLRQDEAGHVRLARQLARRLGCEAQQQAQLDKALAARLQRLLEPVAPALRRLGEAAAELSGSPSCA